MSSDVSEETHICVRCGHANGPTASFCVECGFDLSSALQRDYDSYRDVSRGELTLSESDCLPVSIVRTLTGMPSASGAPSEDGEGKNAEASAPPSQAAELSAPEDLDQLDDADEIETRMELEGLELPEKFDEPQSAVEPLEMDQIEDPFAPFSAADLGGPKSRPVHENLREGVTTYVHASERSFRRQGAPPERTSLAISIGIAVAVGLVIVVLILILTR